LLLRAPRVAEFKVTPPNYSGRSVAAPEEIRNDSPEVKTVELLKRMYDNFNARDMEAVLAALHENVVWANGMEGGYVHGREGVRQYWTRQWAEIDPRVEPVGFTENGNGQVAVEVHQVVRDLNGNVLKDTMVGHLFQIKDGLITRFDIRVT
jgi:ketosteroid isomerase-like protein